MAAPGQAVRMPSDTLPARDRPRDLRGLIAPVRSFRPLVVVCLAIIVMLVVTGRMLAASPSWTAAELSVDQQLSRGHVPVLDALALAIRTVLEPGPGLVIVAVIAVAVLVRTRDRIVTLTFVLAVGGGYLASELVKLLVHRARPDYHLLAHPLSTEADTASFPSGHVCLATAIAFGLVLLLRGRPAQKWAIVAGTAGVVVVAWSRLYIGEHYPTDVLASIVFTTAAMLAFIAIWNRWLAAPAERLLLPGGGRPAAHALRGR